MLCGNTGFSCTPILQVFFNIVVDMSNTFILFSQDYKKIRCSTVFGTDWKAQLAQYKLFWQC